jgi:hypothetical protein
MSIKILPASHVDHGVPVGTLQYALEYFANRDKFFAEVIHLPDGFPGVPSGLYGPLAGDDPVEERDVRYIVRLGRRCSSRMVERVDRLVRTLRYRRSRPGRGWAGAVHMLRGSDRAP